MRPDPSWGLGAAIGAAVVLLSSCGSSTSSTTTARSTTTTITSSTAGTTPPGGVPTNCRASQLRARRVGSAAAAGHIVITYGLANTSATACTLLGYPGVGMVDASGRALPAEVSHGGSYTFAAETPTTVTLSPGAEASFFLGYSDVPSGNQTSCPQSVRVYFTPPGDTRGVALADRIAPCGNGAVTVSPVHAGTAPPP